ncbi:hypothetical protein SAMN05216198_1490 [Halopseudomonas litoralis]|uniref:Uncharacterized protein n=1 Tax=Halopseudomonas litoralis TaxID=797277 RepID=A0A1H1QHW5_9GAMM|nr:hypothetical protein SAMN05216198_1490 [Halopseudomonas litoralis]
MPQIHVTDTIVHAFAQLVDDSGNNGSYRYSHRIRTRTSNQCVWADDLRSQAKGEDNQEGHADQSCAVRGKDKPTAASQFAMGLLGKIRACGGFRTGAPNFVGSEVIANAKSACKSVGLGLADDGTPTPKVLKALRGPELTDALLGYARRAQRGAEGCSSCGWNRQGSA